MVIGARGILSAEDQARITDAIAALERGSAAELVVVVARRSASYAAYSAMGAASLALLGGWAAAIVEPSLPVVHLAILQAGLLVAAAVLFFLTPLGILLVPPAVKRARAAAMARLEFAGLVNDRTRHKDGLLLFVSVAEHYIEIIADDTIAAAIPQDRWQQMVDRFVSRAKGTRIGDGLLGVIKECGAVLAERFPAQPGQANELPDRMKEV